MIRTFLLLPVVAMLTSCGSLQPVKDSAERSTLILPTADSAKTLYPAPVFTVMVPTYLNESTVWYSDDSGVLTSLNDYVWAEPLSKSLRQEFSLALAREEPFPPSSRIEIYFPRFNLLADGSAIAVAEVRFSSPTSEKVLPLITISVKDVWNPTNPGSYLAGYQALLASTIKEINSALSESETKTDSTQPSPE